MQCANSTWVPAYFFISTEMYCRNMSKLSKTERKSSLIEHLKARLLLAVGLLIFAVSTVTYNNQRAINNQTVSIQNDANGMLRSMLDQETSLRGYISTDNATFLQPFTAI